MNRPADTIHSRTASAEITIPRGEFSEINNSLNYAAHLLVKDAQVDMTERVLKGLKLAGDPTGPFDGLGQSFQGELKSAVVEEGDSSLIFTIFRRDPDDIYMFNSIPEGAMDTASTTFLQYRGPHRDLVRQHSASEIAGLLDDLFGTDAYSKNLQRNAERPLSYFIKDVMNSAWRHSSADSVVNTYYADQTVMESPELQSAVSIPALKRGLDPMDLPATIAHTESRLSIARVRAGTPMIRNILLSPTTITRDRSPFRQTGTGDYLTLHTEFRAETALTGLKEFRSGLKQSKTRAEMHVENPGAPLPRREDLYEIAKDMANNADPTRLITRSLKILGEGKNLPLLNLA